MTKKIYSFFSAISITAMAYGANQATTEIADQGFTYTFSAMLNVSKQEIVHYVFCRPHEEVPEEFYQGFWLYTSFFHIPYMPAHPDVQVALDHLGHAYIVFPCKSRRDGEEYIAVYVSTDTAGGDNWPNFPQKPLKLILEENEPYEITHLQLTSESPSSPYLASISFKSSTKSHQSKTFALGYDGENWNIIPTPFSEEETESDPSSIQFTKDQSLFSETQNENDRSSEELPIFPEEENESDPSFIQASIDQSSFSEEDSDSDSSFIQASVDQSSFSEEDSENDQPSTQASDDQLLFSEEDSDSDPSFIQASIDQSSFAEEDSESDPSLISSSNDQTSFSKESELDQNKDADQKSQEIASTAIPFTPIHSTGDGKSNTLEKVSSSGTGIHLFAEQNKLSSGNGRHGGVI